MWQTFVDWFLSLGPQYGVNPIIFGSIYVGAIPFFTLCVAWLVRNLRAKKPIVLPTMLAGLCFVSAYLYLLIVGMNIPVWVYVFIAAMVAYGVYSTVQKIRSQAAGDGH
jgi:heme A synthase